jgi:hypothetical protein
MLNTAQTLLQSFFGPPARGPDGYKAPHAYRGTPPRLHHPRKKKSVRLFKGQRP